MANTDDFSLVPQLALLEAPFDAVATLPTESTRLFRFALICGDYWAGLAIAWLEQGAPVPGLDEDLKAFVNNSRHDKRLRFRAKRVRKKLEAVLGTATPGT